MKNSRIKYAFAYIFLFAVAKIYANENDLYISVTQHIRTLSGTYAELDSPQISLTVAQRGSDGEGALVQIKYDFKVVRKTLWVRAFGGKVRAAIVIPKNLGMSPVSMSGCGLIDNDLGDNKGLPKRYRYDYKGMNYFSNHCFWFTFSSRLGTSASIEFLASVENYKHGDEIPIKLKFWHLDSIDFEYPSDEPLMKSTNRTFTLLITR